MPDEVQVDESIATFTYVVRPGCTLNQDGKVLTAGARVQLTELQATDAVIRGSVDLLKSVPSAPSAVSESGET